MENVTWERREDGDHIFWVARSGRYSLRIDANKPGVYRWSVQDVNDRNRRVAGISLPTATPLRRLSERPLPGWPDRSSWWSSPDDRVDGCVRLMGKGRTRPGKQA